MQREATSKQQSSKLDLLSLQDRNMLPQSSGNEIEVREQIVLDPELLNCLHRRGRRRLREIQTSCRVNVWLDTLRGVLHLNGSEVCVAAAKNLIAALGGPRIPVSIPTWAELLRTRKLQTGPEAAVARIQLESGCRLHIERGKQEVHLFGNPESVAKAQKLLMELEQQCVEEVMVSMANAIDSMVLQTIASSCGVTFRIENDHICILGIRKSVKEAVDTLKKHLEVSGLELPAPATPAEIIRVKENNKNKKTEVAPKKDGNANSMPNPCPTCNACPFCAACGHPTTYLDNVDGSTFVDIQSAPWMWQQLPYMPYDVGTDGMMPMTYVVPAPQNVPLCFVPALVVPGDNAS